MRQTRFEHAGPDAVLAPTGSLHCQTPRASAAPRSTPCQPEVRIGRGIQRPGASRLPDALRNALRQNGQPRFTPRMRIRRAINPFSAYAARNQAAQAARCFDLSWIRTSPRRTGRTASMEKTIPMKILPSWGWPPADPDQLRTTNTPGDNTPVPSSRPQRHQRQTQGTAISRWPLRSITASAAQGMS